MISIIVPIHNAALTLTKCVNSLTSQTFKNIEVLLINNGSTDDSWSACLELASKDSRVKAIGLSEKGVSSARNRGIQESIGDYVMFVDADDWVDNNVCELFVNENRLHNYDLFCFSAQYHKENSSLKSFLFAQNVQLLSENQKEELQIKVFAPEAPCFNYKTNTRFLGSAWGKIYKKDVLIKHDLHFSSETIISEDVLFNTLALDHFDRIGYSRNCFYHYEQQTNSAQSRYRPDSEKYFDFVITQIRQWLEQTKKNRRFVDAANCLFVHYLFGILKEDLVHRDNGYTLTQRCEALEKLLKKENFQTLLQNVNKDYFSTSEKILMLLMKMKLYKLIIVLLQVYLR
ncbi:glycosyltransferase family 2 protein [Fibrobacter sp. UWT2]|uniref:glycosyltransferase n=1 Tax=Fibrobacter sp. UWT2 TaxID=1896224 RepID=UPI0015B75CD9|nr:glycosyltransferase family 2 protein [Fibrobacter sp. UWT2]